MVKSMKTFKAFRNYGVMGAENRIIWTAGVPLSEINEETKLEVPDGWELYRNQMEQLMVSSPWGWNYEINDVLHGNEAPCFYALDKEGKRYREYLKEVA